MKIKSYKRIKLETKLNKQLNEPKKSFEDFVWIFFCTNEQASVCFVGEFCVLVLFLVVKAPLLSIKVGYISFYKWNVFAFSQFHSELEWFISVVFLLLLLLAIKNSMLLPNANKPKDA